MCRPASTISISLWTSRPRGLWIVPDTSWIVVTLAPASAKPRAATAPTLPKPWTQTRAPGIGTPALCAAAWPTTNTPRPVASWRPRLPPSEIGLPVTTPVDVRPWFTE